MELYQCIFPIYSGGTIVGQGFVADGYFITAAHVVKDFPDCFAVLIGKRFELSKEEPAFIGEGDINDDPQMMDVVLYPFDKIDSPLHLFDYVPKKGENFDSYCMHEVTEVNSLNPHFKLTMAVAVSTGDDEGNYFYCRCKRYGGSSGSPLLKGNEVVGIMHGGDNNGLSAFLKSQDLKRYITFFLITKVTDEDYAYSYTDEYGVQYSADGKRLLRAPKEIVNYSIPIGTEVVCDWAFGGCEELEVIDFCESLVAIGDRAFHECTSIKSIVVPNGVLKIGIGAFSGCESIKSVILTIGIKSLEAEAFQACNSLESIILPDSLIRIKEYAFAGCSSLESITIPSSVTQIERGVFEGCKCKIICNSDYFTGGFDLCSVREKRLIYCSTGIIKYVFPESINVIGEFAFFDCTMLKSIDMPDSVVNIEMGAFCGCDSLSDIRLSNSIKYIGSYAFSGCNSIITIYLPESIISIGKDAFEDCTSLKSIFVPNGTRAQFEEMLPELTGKIVEMMDNHNYQNSFNNDDEIEEGWSFKGKRWGLKRKNP